jgi:DNA-binding response OmpR family regulator
MKRVPASTSHASAILVVEDDENLRDGLAVNLSSEGYQVVAVADAAAATRALVQTEFELLILDVMLPGEDGYSFCRRLRAEGCRARILMLTARNLEDDVVRGFEAGAQDYVVKPFRVRELLARVGALVRRGEPALDRMEFGTFVLDLSRRTVAAQGGHLVELTRTEFDLLAYFLRHRERALTRDELLDAVWGRDVVVDPRTVDNFVSNLKRKLDWSPTSGFVLRSVRGVGYRFELVAMTER